MSKKGCQFAVEITFNEEDTWLGEQQIRQST